MVSSGVITIETFFCSNDDIAVCFYADAVCLAILQDDVFAVVIETKRLGVEARNSIGGSYPEMVRTVESHASHPVIAQATLVAFLLHVENLHLATFHIIYIQSLAIDGNVEVALPVIGHAVNASTGKGQFLYVCSCGRVVTIEGIAVANPVVAVMVFVDDASSCR